MSANLRIDRVLARNPGPFTGPGTNTYVIGDDVEVIVIDPGPVDRQHQEAIMATVADRLVEGVIVTHTHSDHAPLANPLAAEIGAPALGYATGPGFDPDIRLSDGSSVDVAQQSLLVVHTPGHADDHLCFRLGDTMFTGDHIMGGSSVMVDDMAPYLRSLAKLRGTGLETLLPGHGESMTEPDEVISWYIAHRMAREGQIVAAIESGCGSIGAIVEAVYADVDSALHPLAARSVVAHMKKLSSDGVARRSGDDWDSAVELMTCSD